MADAIHGVYLCSVLEWKVRGAGDAVRGGAREGAGAPPKDPEAGPRKMWSGRLPLETIATLKRLVNEGRAQSEADVIVTAVKRFAKRTR